MIYCLVILARIIHKSAFISLTCDVGNTASLLQDVIKMPF